MVAGGFAALQCKRKTNGRVMEGKNHHSNKCKNSQAQLLLGSGVSPPNCGTLSEYYIFFVSEERATKTSEFCH